MCVVPMQIKSRSKYGSRFAFVPCGVCEECRQSLKNQWAFRLRTELLYCSQRKWHVGFFTLTYNDESLPVLPAEVFKDYVRDGEPQVPCFSRHDVRTFIDNIRKRLNERYQLKDNNRCRYLLACEYGSHTKRPHMHGLICFPPQVPPEEVYDLIKYYWCTEDKKSKMRNKGFVFPRHFRGGVDSHGYRHKAFLIDGDVSGAAVYAAKYCCKDLDFYESIKDFELDKTTKLYKNCMPFHIQSKSIGLQFFQNKSPAELLDCLKNGATFVGSTKRLPLPLYIRNKILYSPYYQFEPVKNGDWWYDFEADKWRFKAGQGTHKRFVRKEALEFYKEHKKEIFYQKVDYYKSLFEDMQNEDFWYSKNVDRLNAQKFANGAKSLERSTGFDGERLAVGYVAYYGVRYEHCHYMPPEEFYISRYSRFDAVSKKRPLISKRYYDSMTACLGYLMSCLRFCSTVDLEKRKRIAKIIDRYNSLV